MELNAMKFTKKVFCGQNCYETKYICNAKYIKKKVNKFEIQ